MDRIIESPKFITPPKFMWQWIKCHILGKHSYMDIAQPNPYIECAYCGKRR